MERTFLLLSFALGGVVWLCGLLTAGLGGRQTDSNRPSRIWMSTALLLPLLVFLVTLPGKPPFFAPGHGLGIGFLIGGVLGWLSVWTVSKALSGSTSGAPVSAAAAIAAPVGLALMASVVPPLWMRDSLLDGLCGIAIGWLCAALIGHRVARAEQDSGVRTVLRTCLALSAGASVLFCSLAALGELRGLIDLVGKSSAAVHWDAPGFVFASSVSVLLLVLLLPPTLTLRLPLVALFTGWVERRGDGDAARAAARRGWRLGLGALVLLVVGRIVSVRFAEQGDELWKTKSAALKSLFTLIGPAPFFHVIGLALIVAIVICWLLRDVSAGESAPDSARPPGQGGALGAFVLAAASMLAFQSMGGFGMCLLLTVLLFAAGLVCAAGIADLHEQSAVAAGEGAAAFAEQTMSLYLTRLLLFGALLVLYRFFSVRFESELKGVGLTDHYALFGLMFGAALPPLLRNFLTRVPSGSADTDAGRLYRLAVTGLLVLALPTFVIAVWGAKCALSMLMGLALSTVFEGSLLSALLAIAVALAMTQWAHHVLPLAQLTRDQKVNVLFWTSAVTILAMLLAEYGGKMRGSAMRSAPTSPSRGSAR